MAISQELLDLLVCPACKTPVKLTADEKGLRCATCRIVYPIRDGFPVLVVEEAELPPGCGGLGQLPCQMEDKKTPSLAGS